MDVPSGSEAEAAEVPDPDLETRIDFLKEDAGQVSRK